MTAPGGPPTSSAAGPGAAAPGAPAPVGAATPPVPPAPRRAGLGGSVRLVLGVLAVLALGAGAFAGARAAFRERLAAPPAPPRVTQEIVVEQVRSVARLVASEATLRDVVTYEQTRYFATKRALLVVTGRVSAGFVLDGAGTSDGGVDVRVDTTAKRIAVSLPPARVLSVEVLDVRTYDEQAGLLNRFRPEDRDQIQRLVRQRLERAGPESGLLQQAERSAVGILRTLLARDGYTVDVVVRGPRPVARPG